MQSKFLTLKMLKHGQGPTRAIELMEGATVGDILKQIASFKHLPTNQIFITEDRWPLPDMAGTAYATCTVVGAAPSATTALVPSGVTVKLLKSEVPEGMDVQLGGVDDLEGLPDVITVEPKKVRESFEKQEAMDLNDELIVAYSDEQFQKKLAKLQEKVKSGAIDKKKYPRVLGDLTLEVQKKLLPKYGLEPSPKGVQTMVRLLDVYRDDDEMNLKANTCRGLLGLFWDWLPQEK
mmetsp:Transcript_45059/g.101421  ORF Transcript_45059/g.101421 Transcript_45059/m.101421 type:complete len:235 (-) Transcript_45059:111-815(-)